MLPSPFLLFLRQHKLRPPFSVNQNLSRANRRASLDNPGEAFLWSVTEGMICASSDSSMLYEGRSGLAKAELEKTV
jgi:hypothetical protein